MGSPQQSFDDNEKANSDVQIESAQSGMMTEPAVKYTAEEEEKLYRRVDWRILPILALLVSTDASHIIIPAQIDISCRYDSICCRS